MMPFNALQRSAKPYQFRATPSVNLAKVGVEGSNPFARSRFSQGNQSVKAVPRGRFLLPRPAGRCRGSTGEAAGIMLRDTPGGIWHGRYGHFTPLGATGKGCRGHVPATQTHDTECLRPSRDGHTDTIGLGYHHRSVLPAAMRIGSTSRSESGSRTNPWAA